MNNIALQEKLNKEILAHIESRKSLMLASLDQQGAPYASYAPFAYENNCIYVLVSDIAIHGVNLAINPKASVLIVEDEDSAAELFARKRVNYRVTAEQIVDDSKDWRHGIDALKARHGERIHNLSQLSDFHLFRLTPNGGRYVKGFGKAYQIEEGLLAGAVLNHLTDGHKPKSTANRVA